MIGRANRSRLAASLIAGGSAIGLNTLALKAADAIPLATARGGLLRLVRPWLAPAAEATGIDRGWSMLGGPGPDTVAFQVVFHLLVGLLMALFYAFWLEPRLPGRPWARGVAYAAAVWLLNAAVVLPATGEGFAGHLHLSAAGMIWFAAAHTLFFVLLAMLYAKFRAGRTRTAAVDDGAA